jgi:putative addiction module component (TIGR02574 family)
MPAMTTLDIARLTPKERLDLIGELWDSLSAEDVRLSPAQDAELARRMASFEADRQDAAPWSEVDAELARRLR